MLKTNKCFLDTISALQTYFEKKRKDNKSFLSNIFLVPTLEKEGILKIVDPSEEEELSAFLGELNLHIFNLKSTLHNECFICSSARNSSIVLGRPFLPWHYVRGMERNTEDSDFRNRLLKLKAIANFLNVFQIDFSDSGILLYMNNNGYCKHARMSSIPDHAQWRVILVDETNGTFNTSSKVRKGIRNGFNTKRRMLI